MKTCYALRSEVSWLRFEDFHIEAHDYTLNNICCRTTFTQKLLVITKKWQATMFRITFASSISSRRCSCDEWDALSFSLWSNAASGSSDPKHNKLHILEDLSQISELSCSECQLRSKTEDESCRFSTVYFSCVQTVRSCKTIYTLKNKGSKRKFVWHSGATEEPDLFPWWTFPEVLKRTVS